MAVSTIDTQKALSRAIRKMFDFDPDGTTLTDVSWQRLKGEVFLVGIMRTVGTGNVDAFKIRASKASDGSSPVDIKAKTISAEPNAVGDYIWLEVTIDDILAAAGAGYKYVSASIQMATGTDELAVYYEMGLTRSKHEDLTADYVS